MSTKTAATSARPEVNENILALADTIKKDLKIGEGGVAELPKDIYEQTLPENITMADVKRVADHNTAFAAGLTLALGEAGVAAFKKDKKLAQVSVDVTAGKDKVAALVQREKQVADGKGGQQVKHFVANTKWTFAGAGNRGALKKIRDHLSAVGAAAAAG